MSSLLNTLGWCAGGCRYDSVDSASSRSRRSGPSRQGWAVNGVTRFGLGISVFDGEQTTGSPTSDCLLGALRFSEARKGGYGRNLTYFREVSTGVPVFGLRSVLDGVTCEDSRPKPRMVTVRPSANASDMISMSALITACMSARGCSGRRRCIPLTISERLIAGAEARRVGMCEEAI